MAQAFRTQNLRLLGNLLDVNDNELIKFSSIASAVNELTISNAATTGSPSISATGDDTNIGLNLISKGTGLVQINGKAISLANSFTTSGNFALTFTTTATTSLTLPTSGTLATTSQIPTVYDNTLTLAGSGGISLSGTPTFTANASADKTITISIADGALAISKLADITTLRILGRTSASTGPVEQLDGTGVVAVIGSSAVSRAVNLGGGIAGQIPYQSGANTTAFSAAGSTNQVLLSGGSGAPTWANQSSLSVGSATTAGSVANALTISSPLTGTSYNGSAAISIGLQDASATQAGGVSISSQTFAGNKTFKDNVIVSGNLTVNGTTVTINSSTLSVDDKNIELGSVVAIPSLSATVNIEAGDTNVIVSSTNGLIVGQALTKISGTGAFGANPVISSITSATQFTVSPVHATTGSIVFSVGGATDVTADGGGITLKGTTDKTIIWVDSTDAWTLSEHLNIASGKSYRINGTDVLSSTTLGSGVVNSSLTSVGTLTNLTVTNTITGSVSGSAGSLSGTYTFWGQNFNGTQNVSGNLTSVGNITGTGGITITAGGSNQNVVLTPSGTGYTLLNGNVGIGTTVPLATLDVRNQVMIGDASIGGVAYQTLSIGGHTRIHGTYRLQFGSANGGYASMGITGPQTGTITFNTWDGSADRERLRIVNTDGNVGIGTTNPVQKLDVSGSIYINNNASYLYGKTTGGSATRMIGINAVNDFYIGSVDQAVSSIRINNNGSDRVIIDSSGNVGIGIINPTYKLDVAGAIAMHDENQHIDSRFYGGTFLRGWSDFEAGNESNITYTTDTTCPVGIEVLSISTWTWARGPKIRLDKTQNYEVEFWIKRHAANTSGQFYFVVSNFDSNGTRITGDGTDWHYPTTFAQNTMVVGTWYKFKFIVGPYGGAKDHSPNARYISVGFIVNYTTGTDVIYMTGFKCRPIPRYNNDNLTLYNNGFVGIGTTIPSEKLDVIDGNISTSGEIYSLGGRLSLYRSAGNSYIDWSTGRNLIFRTETSVGGAGDSEKVRINSFGCVGIGTTNPLNKLDIYGGDVNIRNDSAGATSLCLRNWTSGGTAQMIFGTAPGDDQSTTLSFASNVFKIENYGDPTSSIKFGTRNTAGTSAIRMTINPDGNVGIDTETPNNKLSVLGSTSIGSGYNTAAPTNGLIVEGSVGIGSSSPAAKFVVSASSITTTSKDSYAVAIGNSNTDLTFGSDASYGYIQTWGSKPLYINNQGNNIILGGSIGLNVGIGTTNPNDRLTILAGNYLSFQTVNLTFNSGRAARIGATTTGSGIGELIFETYKGGSGGGEKMRINSDGNVGIGISTPVYKTEIYSGAKTSAFTGLAISNFNNYDGTATSLVTSQLRFAILENPITTYDASQRTFAILESGNEVNNSSSDGFFAISTRKTAVLSEKFRITSSGNVGIGTTNPVTKLAILGGDDKDTGPIISLSGNSVNQFESGRIRFTEANIAASPFYQGAYVHYDGSNNVFNIGVHTNVDSLTSSDVNAISILRSNAFVGIGTTIPSTKLEVIGTVKATLFDGPVNQVNITADDSTNSSHYLYFGATNSGASIVKASTKIRFNPSTGAFSSTTKSFRIPHLTKSGYDLVYGSLESPYHGVRLTGKGKTNGNRAEVILPDYINILVDKETVHIQLTPIKCAKILYVDDLFIDDNKFTVKYDKSWFEKSKDVEFYWDFTAERKDVPKLIVEEKI